jgi:hypothetical protein
MKKICLALALLLGAAVVVPALTAPAEAQQRTSNCRYTSGDIAKGYRC